MEKEKEASKKREKELNKAIEKLESEIEELKKNVN
jgi:prefoldin subunit 5